MRARTIDLPDLSLHLVEAGPSQAPTVLFLHGWPQSSRAFAAVMAAMEGRYRVAALDLPGVGRSRGRPRGADKRTLAGYVEAAIEHADLGPVTLVGHDV